jgi:hypothetical protein
MPLRLTSTRSADLSTPAPINDVVIRNQSRLADQLKGVFDFHYAITFPIQGSDEFPDD